ncbi:Radixin like, partial [Actinidia chinensis var. chinensis]
MSPASRSKSKDKRAGKEPLQKASAKPAGHANPDNGVPVSGYNPLLGKFHTLETAPLSSASPLHINSPFRNIDDTDDHSGNSLGAGMEYDTVSNNGSWSGESEDHKERTSHPPHRQEAMPVADNDKREKIRQKNEKKHQRQKEKRAQELHERCSGFLMSRKLEGLAQQLVSMGFSLEQATMALILNEGSVEESVTWLFESGKEVDKHQELDEGNLKIDISEELAHIADMEIRFKCSKQEVERAIVACEGDLEKAAETLRVQKQDHTAAPPKPEETGDPPTVSNGKLSISGNQNSLRAQQKPNPYSTVQQRRDEKDFNYAKTTDTVGVPVESGGKHIVQAVRKVQPKLDGAKSQQITVPADKSRQSAVSSPLVSYSLASPLQASPPLAKTETRYTTLGSELKNPQLGSVKEPVVVMQRPQSQSANVKQAPTSTTSVSSSPPGTTSGWYPNMVE